MGLGWVQETADVRVLNWKRAWHFQKGSIVTQNTVGKKDSAMRLPLYRQAMGQSAYI